ncbi:DMT family transporter [Marinimicrococcus flavescens]|uniref:DMT family transporter n=1 Tax=Marinimicrococcus flavescens TaxID=3031815 RepID=A0AAP3UXC8_9PROT|nr:DMT family transporter [Marinimicrococcus flavescens]
MQDLWIPVTIAAALFQTLRTAVQKYLAGRLSTTASAFTRFAYGAPFALAYLAGLAAWQDAAVPAPDLAFVGWVLLGAVAQIIATGLLIAAVTLRNFTVGVAWSKTEILQAALVGIVLLGEPVGPVGTAGIMLATAGVMLMSLAKSGQGWRALLAGLTERAALVGIGAGAGFAISAVGFRGAALSLGLENPIFAASVTLAWATTLQTLLLGAWLAWREPGQLMLVLRSWRISGLAGLASVLGSGCWFTAMTIQVVPYVRTLGLVELVFTYLLTVFWFRERPKLRELLGVLAMAGGIAMVLLAG